ncbi:glycosyltransferase family 4 protein [Gryllotalpicola ginsengisoli]|uniref:glycosyltransferase family 4 protein n=1 Tax=Gryllotalpicola ginsengisoli TaxID=444608 RepID=UPI0003B7560B|nr:glycosyltransferase family 1 protein [Gryllotalpicola ginsengisoli]
MRVFFDCRYVRTGRPDGITRYTVSLLAEFAKLHPVTMLVSSREQLAVLPGLPWELIPSQTSPLEPWVAYRVNRLQPDIVFSPMQTMGSRGRRYALVLTVHDLIYYTHRTPPRDLPWFVRGAWRLYHLAWWPQRMLLNGADQIVAVSQTTKELILRKRLARRPVSVVHNSAGEPAPEVHEFALHRAPPRGTPRQLVHMGQFLPYKNVDALVRAMAFLPGYELHLMSPVTDAERERLRALAPGAALVFRNGASDAEYEDALLGAHALVTTSWDEGFGIPVLEAMRVGTPVVASDIPIFREVGGEAAVFADPSSPEDVARGIRSLEDPDAWVAASRAGIAQAARFSWAASAQHLLTVLTAAHARWLARSARRR